MKFVTSIRKRLPKLSEAEASRINKGIGCYTTDRIDELHVWERSVWLIAWSRVKTMKTGLISVRRKFCSDTKGSNPPLLNFIYIIQ